MRLFLDLDAFFGFDSLVQTVTPLATFHEATGEFVDDNDLAFFDNVVHVGNVQAVGFERVVDQVRPVHVTGSVKRLHTRHLFSFSDAVFGQRRGVIFLVDDIVDRSFERPGDAVRFSIFRRVLMCWTRDNQRSSRFIDQNVVNFIDDREREWSLGLLSLFGESIVTAGGRPHVVAQVIKTKFVVGSVSNVALVCLLTFGCRHVALNGANGQA